jgi:hypothetical protein
MSDDFVDLMLQLTNYIQNERTASFNEGLDTARASIKDFMRAELKLDPLPDATVPDMLFDMLESIRKGDGT